MEQNDYCSGNCYICTRLSQIDVRDEKEVYVVMVEVLELIKEHKLGCGKHENPSAT